jgi:hypothetical protein
MVIGYWFLVFGFWKTGTRSDLAIGKGVATQRKPKPFTIHHSSLTTADQLKFLRTVHSILHTEAGGHS